jgi:hypothetical protein
MGPRRSAAVGSAGDGQGGEAWCNRISGGRPDRAAGRGSALRAGYAGVVRRHVVPTWLPIRCFASSWRASRRPTAAPRPPALCHRLRQSRSPSALLNPIRLAPRYAATAIVSRCRSRGQCRGTDMPGVVCPRHDPRRVHHAPRIRGDRLILLAGLNGDEPGVDGVQRQQQRI